jgi:DNA-binding NtrC family response regulator
MPLTGCRVLIIEDEYYIATELKGILTDHGATVIGPVAELSEAMAQVRREGFDVAMQTSTCVATSRIPLLMSYCACAYRLALPLDTAPR